MEQEKIFDDISNLPPEAQQQVADFIAFLRTHYKRPDAEKQTKRINLVNEPFIPKRHFLVGFQFLGL